MPICSPEYIRHTAVLCIRIAMLSLHSGKQLFLVLMTSDKWHQVHRATPVHFYTVFTLNNTSYLLASISYFHLKVLVVYSCSVQLVYKRLTLDVKLYILWKLFPPSMNNQENRWLFLFNIYTRVEIYYKQLSVQLEDAFCQNFDTIPKVMSITCKYLDSGKIFCLQIVQN